MKSIICLIIQEVEISKIYNLDTQINSIEVFNKIVREISKYNFFLEIIKLCPLTDYKFENLFLKIRFFLLINITKINLSDQNENFFLALALQSFVNEYIYYETEIETEKIKELEILIYKSLASQKQPNSITLLCFVYIEI